MSKRNNALEALFDELSGISNKEYQRRVWIRGEGPECDDFDETVCRYFETMESIFDEQEKWGFSDYQLNVLKKFNDRFRAFADHHSYEPKFIDTPEWDEIVQMAKEVLKVFDYKNEDPHNIQVLQGLLEDIRCISDKEYQRRVWIRADGPECDDFIETVCRYSPTADFILEKYKEFGISDIQFQSFKRFYDKFEPFSAANNWPEEFIDTPEWDEIVEMAKEVLKAFDYKKEKSRSSILTNENRREILKNFLNTIKWISDKEYQRRAWIRGETPGTDFGEAINFFSDLGDPILDEYKDFWITNAQYQLLKTLRDRFEEFCDNNHWPPDFINTPEWDEIVEMAKEVLKAFDYQKEENSTETPPNASGNENSPRV